MITRKKTIIISLLLGILLLASFFGFHASNKTTFGKVLSQNISDKEEVTHIILQKKVDLTGNFLWSYIDDPELIELFIAELSEIPIRRQFTRTTRNLNNTMTIHTLSNSYYFDFDEDHFVGNGKDYKIGDGSLISNIRSLKDDLEWEADEDFIRRLSHSE